MDKKMKAKFLIIFFLLSMVTIWAQDSDFEENDFKEEAETGLLKGIALTGFLEIEQGLNITGSGPLRDTTDEGIDWIMANRRIRFQTSKMTSKSGIFLKLDFNRDEIIGETTVDVRELRLQYRLFNWMDISIGRQVTTWGVGDMIFINDLFPKNWVANFSGRDMEAMKDSSTSLRITSYIKGFTFDMVYHPRFTADTTPTGCYFSVFDPNSGQLVGNRENCNENPFVKSPSVKNDEIAISIKKKLGPLEWALYGYDGFYKNPKGVTISDDQLVPYYPGLFAFGASAEGQIGPGIFSAELGFYDSKEDRKGINPMIENSMFKYLIGYRLDINGHLSLGSQWYREIMMNYNNYQESIGFNKYGKKKNQDTFTLRLTFKGQRETLWINLFSYYRPQDKDSFTRLDISKKLDNHFSITAGVNIFTGEQNYEDREFGMQRNDDNLFLRLRYSF